MVLRGDRDFAAVQIFDRLVGAAMTEFQFECRSPKREAANLMAETNSKDRLLPHQIGDGLVRIGNAAGSPGPFERKIPSGLSASACSAEVDAGTTVTPKPFCRSSRKIFCLIP